MTHKEVFTRNTVWIVFSILMVFMTIGSFFDYSISLMLYNKESILGRFLAAYGQLPNVIAMSVGGTLMIYVCEKRMQGSTILAIISGIALNVIAIYVGVMEPRLYYPEVSKVFLAVVAITILTLVNIYMIYLVKDSDTREIKRYVKFMLFIVIGHIIIVNGMKVVWGRPRMRMIIESSETFFQPWWLIDHGLKSTLTALGIASEEFKSFPSGHTASAAGILFISVLPFLSCKLRGKGHLLFYGSCTFAFIVGISRIIIGAHFLTDITVGFAVSFGIVLIAYAIFYKNGIRKGC